MAGLRSMFGPSQKEIWRQLSAEMPADFVEGSFLKSDKVQATHGQWIVTLDKYVVSHRQGDGRLHAHARARTSIRTASGSGSTGGALQRPGQDARHAGRRGRHAGASTADFIIKGTDDGKLRQLFANPKIRELISEQKDIDFSVKDDEGWFGPTFPDGVDELAFLVVGVIKDVERLKHLYELFAETLDELCRIGSAYQSDPDVRLIARGRDSRCAMGIASTASRAGGRGARLRCGW